jgi:hypothetical protein
MKGDALEHGTRGTMKGVALGVNNYKSKSQMDIVQLANSDSNQVGTIDNRINFVDEDANVMKLHNQMYSGYNAVQVSTTL